DDFEIQMGVEKSADRSAPAKQLKKDHSGCHRRNHEGQHHKSFYKRLSFPIASRKQPAGPNSGWQNECGAQCRHTQAEKKNLPFAHCESGSRNPYLRKIARPSSPARYSMKVLADSRFCVSRTTATG